MKLRIHDNSLRLRLSQSDVARLRDEGRVEEKLTFAPGRTLTYSVSAANVSEIAGALEPDHIHVSIPTAAARHRIETDEVGMETTSAQLGILIEKDFQCLHRASADDAYGFPNPLADSRR
jgi:hypothetical protein